MVAFSGFYESHEPPPSGDARGIVLPHHHGHQNGQQRGGHVAHRCVDYVPGGRRGNTEQVVARWHSLEAFMKILDLLHRAMCSVFHRRTAMAIRRRIYSLPPPILIAVIVAKDHVMVHLN